MTALQAINFADEQRPNAYDTAAKLQWLAELDGRIQKEIYETHEGMEYTPLSSAALTSQSRELLAPHPYDAIYLYWLYTRIDFLNGETARFNSSALMFNTAWINLVNYVNRNYEPRQNARLTGA